MGTRGLHAVAMATYVDPLLGPSLAAVPQIAFS